MPARRIVITVGDLTDQDVDAIVNAANNDLVLGGGVAGAIRRRGGPSIQDECDAHGPVRVGEAALTGGGQLKARHVIHAASMALGGRTTATSLRASMTATFEIARRRSFETVAVPAVGTGIAGFPMDECRASWRHASAARFMTDGSRQRCDLSFTTRPRTVLLSLRFSRLFRVLWGPKNLMLPELGLNSSCAVPRMGRVARATDTNLRMVN
jgi:O-acetyl-ADP-ribose deacetylase (regulator of RNase III)